MTEVFLTLPYVFAIQEHLGRIFELSVTFCNVIKLGNSTFLSTWVCI